MRMCFNNKIRQWKKKIEETPMPFTGLYVTRISRLQNRMKKKKRYVITETYVHKHSWLILSLAAAFYILDVVAHVFRFAVCDFAFANGDFHMISMWSV